MRALISSILTRFPSLSEAIYRLRKKYFKVENIGRRYSTTRYSMYNSIEEWIKSHHPKGHVLLISERDEHSIKNMLGSNCTFTVTQYPQTDIMNLTKLGKEKFDLVVSDQVLEHVPNPFTAVEQMHRVLKTGGLAINTSCAFNPIHDQPDYFRFTKDGFREIHKSFSKIILLESWGNHKAISRFVKSGVKSFDVRKAFGEKELATENEENWPWSVWCIAKK